MKETWIDAPGTVSEKFDDDDDDDDNHDNDHGNDDNDWWIMSQAGLRHCPNMVFLGPLQSSEVLDLVLIKGLKITPLFFCLSCIYSLTAWFPSILATVFQSKQ